MLRKTFIVSNIPSNVYDTFDKSALLSDFSLRPILNKKKEPETERASSHYFIANGEILGQTNVILNQFSFCCFNNIVFNPTNPDKIFLDDIDDFQLDNRIGSYHYENEKQIKRGIFIGAHKNFGHWIHNHWARLFQLNWKQLSDFKIIIPENCSKVQLDSLIFLGVEPSNIIFSKKSEILKVEELILPQMPWHSLEDGSMWWSPDIFPSIREQIGFGNFKKVEIKRKIFASRKKARWRRLINEDNLFEQLSILGYERVFLEDLDFKEQLDIAAQTSDFICPFGAGTNFFMFMPYNSRFIELCLPIRNMNVNKFFANACSINYNAIVGTLKRSNHSALNSDFFINSDDLLSLVHSI